MSSRASPHSRVRRTCHLGEEFVWGIWTSKLAGFFFRLDALENHPKARHQLQEDLHAVALPSLQPPAAHPSPTRPGKGPLAGRREGANPPKVGCPFLDPLKCDELLALTKTAQLKQQKSGEAKGMAGSHQVNHRNSALFNILLNTGQIRKITRSKGPFGLSK